MINFYLSSIYNFLFDKNPFVLLGNEAFETLKAIWHYQDNQTQVRLKLSHIQNRMQAVESYIDPGQRTAYAKRFDITR